MLTFSIVVNKSIHVDSTSFDVDHRLPEVRNFMIASCASIAILYLSVV